MAELSGYAIGGRITESVVGDGSVIASDIVVTYKLTQADGSDLAAGTRVEDPVEGAEVLKVGYGNVEGGVTSAEGTQSEDGESTLPAANVWVSDRLLKPNVAAAAVDALVPQNLAWKFDVWASAREAKLGNQKGGTKVPLVTYLVQLDGDADYSGNLLTGVTGPGGVNVLDVLQLVDPTPTPAPTNVFATAVRAVAPPLYTITGYTATLPAGETVVGNYADIDAFEAAVTPTHAGQLAQVAGWPAAPIVSLVQAVQIGDALEWSDR